MTDEIEPDFWHIYNGPGQIGDIVGYRYLALGEPFSDALYKRETIEDLLDERIDELRENPDGEYGYEEANYRIMELQELQEHLGFEVNRPEESEIAENTGGGNGG